MVCSAFFSASEKNFTIGDFHSPLSILMKASPLAPKVFAIAVISSTWPMVMPAKPLALIAFTTPPPSMHAAEKLEPALAKIVGEIDQLHPEAAVRLVAAVSVHRFAIGHARERRRNVDAARRLEDRRQHSLDQSEDVLRLDERRFDVDLRELRLAIGAQIFVAKAFRDLKIFLDPADHEELLVLLRRLRERVELARREATRDEEIARAFRRALRKNRRLDFDEALLVEIIARRLGDAMAQAQVARDAAGGADRSSDS